MKAVTRKTASMARLEKFLVPIHAGFSFCHTNPRKRQVWNERNSRNFCEYYHFRFLRNFHALMNAVYEAMLPYK